MIAYIRCPNNAPTIDGRNSRRVAARYCFIIPGLFFYSFLAAQTKVFTSSGSFIAPAGVTTVTAECWGGGGGGQSSSWGTVGNGSGGGAYARKSVSVIPGETYTIQVGHGGGGGDNGGDSWFLNASTVLAKGGGVTSGGEAGASIGDITYSGGNGVVGDGSGSGAGGSSAGPNSNGVIASGTVGGAAPSGGGNGGNGNTYTGNGGSGYAPGGGGGGAKGGTRSWHSTGFFSGHYHYYRISGGAGGKGKVVLSWACPTYSITGTVAGSPVCAGAATSVTLSGNTANLPVGVYTVTYNLSGANTATGATALMTITTAGTGTFNTMALNNSGTTTVAVTNLSSGSSGASCSNTLVNHNTANVMVGIQLACNITGEDAVCAGSAGHTYAAPGGMSAYSWNITGNGTIDGAINGQTVTVIAGAAGSYTLHLTTSDPGGCTSFSCSKTVTVLALPTMTCPANLTVCASALPLDLISTGALPPGGLFSGPGVSGTSYIASAGTTGTVTYVYTDGNGCPNTCMFTITVEPLPVTTCPPNQSVCLSALPLDLTTLGASPPGGMFTGAGVTGSGYAAGLGSTNTVTYSYADGNSCMSDCTFQISVTPQPACVVTGPEVVCAGPQNYPTYTAPAGMADYAWSISGDGAILSATNTQTITVDPGTSGTYTLTVDVEAAPGCVAGCSKTVTITQPAITLSANCPAMTANCGDMITVTVDASTALADILSLQFNVEWDENLLQFVGPYNAPSLGGTAPVVGATGVAAGHLEYNWFDLSGIGKNLDGAALLTLVFKVTGTGGAASVEIAAYPSAIVPRPFEMISNENLYCTGAVVPENNINIALSPVGLTCPPNITVYANDPPFTLPDGMPAGGAHSGTGVSGYTFTPSPAIPGLHTITYAYTAPSGCTNTCSYTIDVRELTSVNITGLAGAYCKTDPATPFTGDPSGGVFTLDGNPAAVFDPAALALGAHTVIYTITDANNNTNSTAQIVEVKPVPVAQPAGMETCETTAGSGTAMFDLASVENTVTGGASGVTVSWFSDAGGSMAIADPATFMSSNNTVYARVTNAVNCSAIATVLLTVHPLPDALPASAAACETVSGAGTAVFDLTVLENTVTGGAPGVTVDWFSDAGLTMAIADPAMHTSGSVNVYAKVINTATNCMNSVAVALTAQPFIFYFVDTDGDGYGNGAPVSACPQPANTATNDDDCDDADPALNPNTLWYLDADNDNYYTGTGVAQCNSPGAGYRRTGLLGGSDCDDSDPDIRPGATELCNNLDDDCDGAVDEASGWNNDPMVNNRLTGDSGGDAYAISDGVGGMIVVWDNGYFGDGTQDIYAQRIDAAGHVLWGPNGMAVCTAAQNQRLPKIVSDGNGGAIVVWVDGRGVDNISDIYAQRISGNGVVQWTPEGVPVCVMPGYQGQPDICTDVNGGAYLVWMDQRPSIGTEIYAQRLDGDGNALWAPNGIALTNSDCANSLGSDGVMIPDGSGNFLVSILRSTGCSNNTAGNSGHVLTLKVNPSGAVLWNATAYYPPPPPATALINLFQIQMTSDGSGGAIVSFHENISGTGRIYAQRLDAAGALQWGGVSTPVQICNTPTLGSSIATDGTGGAIWAWNDVRAGTQVYVQKVNAAGTIQWPINGLLVADNSAVYQSPFSLAPNGTGGALLVTANLIPSVNNFGIFVHQIGSNGDLPWGADGLLVTHPSSGSSWNHFGIVNDGNCEAIVGFRRAGMYASKITCAGTLEGGSPLWYADSDGDGYGDPAVTQYAVCQPSGYVAGAGDCDDSDANVYAPQPYYVDADGDGFGSATVALFCSAVAPAGHAANNTDCDDTDPELNPATVWYLDADNDHYSTGPGIVQCAGPGTGYRYTGLLGDGDCDDADADINPTTVWYLDADNDNYSTGPGVTQCTSPGAGYRYTGLSGTGDCEDTNAAINPGAAEACNSLDDDCDGTVDEFVMNIWYADADGDGYGTGDPIPSCDQPANTAGNDLDCDDTDAALHPGGVETCNGLDDDCDRLADEGAGWSNDPLNNNVLCTDCQPLNLEAISDGAGGMIVAWQFDAGGGARDLYAQRISADGIPQWGTNGVAVCTASNTQHWHKLVNDGAGGAVVVWTDERNSSSDIYAQRINSVGEAQWAADGVPVCVDATFPKFYPDLCSDGNGGTFLVWQDHRFGLSTPQIFGQRLDSDGITQWAVNGLALTNSTCGNLLPSGTNKITPDGSGNCIVSFQRDACTSGSGGLSQVMAQKIDAGGNVLWSVPVYDSPVPVTPNTLWNIGAIQMVSDASGGAVISFPAAKTNSPNPNIYAQRVDAAGVLQWGAAAQPAPISLLGANGTWRAITTDGDGGAILAWNDTGDGNKKIYAQKINSTGVVEWPVNGLLVSSGAPATVYPLSLAPNGSGGAFLSNTHLDPALNPVYPGLYMQQIGSNGSFPWGPDGVLLAHPSTAPVFAALVNDGNCEAVVGFSSGSSLRAAKVSCAGILEGGAPLWYADNDGDTYGDPALTQYAICQPAGYVATQGDCNDYDGAVYEPQSYYVDADGDGFGYGTAVMYCTSTAPAGLVANNTDCDDTDAALNPNTIWYSDADNDNYFTGTGVVQCTSPGPGFRTGGFIGGGDCNDGDGAVNPGATEICGNYQDDDCDGQPEEGCLFEYSGAIRWEHDGATGVNNATVNLSGAATGNDATDTNGDYLISVPYSTGSFTIKPVKNINRLNGVTVSDAMAIQQHLTSVHPITNPYKLIAADVNRSNTISTLDATLINQCLLGNPAANNIFKVFWRFVPQTWAPVLPPWGFPEQIELTGVSTNQSGLDFYGVKIGDVVTTFANPANFGDTDPQFVLRAEDRALKSGDQLTVLFSAEDFDDLAAWQFALNFDAEKLQFDSLETLPGLPLTAEHFGFYEVEAGVIRSAWSQAQGIDLAAGTPVFRLRFRVKQTGGWLSEVIRLDDDILTGEAYTSKLAPAPVELVFFKTTGVDHADPEASGPVLLQNRPNPFSDKTVVEFVLPEACDATLRVFDVNGRLLREGSAFYSAGRHSVELDFSREGASSMLYYELTTPWGVLAKKMVLARK